MRKTIALASILLPFVFQAAHSQPQGASGKWEKQMQAVHSTPSPFRFDVQEIRVEHSGQIVFLDEFKVSGRLAPTHIGSRVFDPDGAPAGDGSARGDVAASKPPGYIVRMGHVGDANVREGALVLDTPVVDYSSMYGTAAPMDTYPTVSSTQSNRTTQASSKRWPAPETETIFGSLIGVPVRTERRSSDEDITTFQGSEMFGDLFGAITFRHKASEGWEKLTLGLTDIDGRRPAVKISFRKDRILLEGIHTVENFQTWPNWEEIEMARADLTPYPGIDRVQLGFHVDADGQVGAFAKVFAANQERYFDLKGIGRYSKLDPSRRYAVGIFTETLPVPAVDAVSPSTIAKSSLDSGGQAVSIEVMGRGFGPDTKVEVVSNQSTSTARISDLWIAPHHNQLRARVAFPSEAEGGYSLKVSTAGQTALLKNAIRLE